MINAIIAPFETTSVSFTCLNWTVVLCLSVDFSQVPVQVWFVSKGAVGAGWIVAGEAPVTLFRTGILN